MRAHRRQYLTRAACALLVAGLAGLAGLTCPRTALADGLRSVSAARAPRHALDPGVLDLAIQAYQCGSEQGHFDKRVLSIIDFSLPSTERRLWVIDLESGRLLHHELVAHGQNSGGMFAHEFSNRVRSHQSSLGLYRTAGTYYGRHGYSLNLLGLEPGVNDRAFDRRIVIHGADYVTPQHIAEYGALGRSWGCPALDHRVSSDIIDIIKEGSALFVYYPDGRWLSRSPFFRCTREPTVVRYEPAAAELKAKAMRAVAGTTARMRGFTP